MRVTAMKKEKGMRHSRITGLVAAAGLLMLGDPARAASEGGGRNFRAELTGIEEVPVVSTGARGTLELRIASDEGSIDFELTYEGIEGGAVTAAHIHVGQHSVNGGVSAFFCGGGGRPACPSPGTTEPITGTILPANVLGPGGPQQVPPGALDELIAAIRAGATYVNVHSTISPGGEIRGQVKPGSVGGNN
jgi:hypothetical protein